MRKLIIGLLLIGLMPALPMAGHAQSELSDELSGDGPSAPPDTTDNYGDSESVESSSASSAQDSNGSEENLYKNEADMLLENKIERNEKKQKVEAEGAPEASEKIKSISELDKLTPFNDVAVIQKRFLPKSNRFEFNPNAGFITNNAFFMTSYVQARLAYAFTEKWALEFSLAKFFDAKYKVTEDLADEAQVATKSLLLPEMYYGADLRWSPIYGKMGSFHEGIVPFDMYFSVGGGVMSTNQDTSPFALHAGTGQIFALSKRMAFRWDLSGYFYTTDVEPAGTAGGTAKKSQSFTDIQLSVGMSFFFPDATYR